MRAPPAWRSAWLVRPVLVALGLVLLIFAAYAVAERLWLAEADLRLRHTLHAMRGLLSALVAALTVAWLAMRRAPPFGSGPLSSDEWVRGPRPTQEQQAAQHLRWFILLRWVAVIVAGGLSVFAVRAGMLPGEVLGPLVGTVAGLAALNLVYTLLSRWAPKLNSGILAFQAYADLGILTLLLHLSGGIENPLAPVMLFHVIIAGMVLGRGHCYLVAATGAALFALMAWGEGVGVLPHTTLTVFPHPKHAGVLLHAAHDPGYVATRAGLQAAILFLTAYFTTTLTDRLRHHERQLSDLADRTLAQSQLLERALEATETGLCVCDRDLRTHWMNRRWASWFGSLPTEESTGACDPLNPVAETLQDGTVRVTEVTLPVEAAGVSGPVPGDGRAFRLSTAPLLDDRGEVAGVVSLAQEVTAQKRVESQMIQAGKLAAVGELAGNVAHEINNPIAIVSGKARLLLSDHREGMSAHVAGELGKIIEEADRIARITMGLLSYTRPSTGARQPLDLRAPLRQALALVGERAAGLGVEIREQLGAMAPVRANADEMQQVFLNLLLNALDAMPEGGRLLVEADERTLDDGRRWVEMRVEDSGSGIPEGVRPRIFEPFFTTKPEGKGTGLGLSICLGLVRSHGGEIRVASGADGGTRVTVRLPVAVSREPAVR